MSILKKWGENLNLIGDAEGYLKTVQALMAKMPQDAGTLLLGDINDRGPDTKGLVQFIMDNPETIDSIFSNHMEMFIDFYKRMTLGGNYRPRYESQIFLDNGGGRTLMSYRDDDNSDVNVNKLIPKEHIDWLDSRPMYHMTDKFFMSHAPVPIDKTFAQMIDRGNGFLERQCPISRGNLLWNRFDHPKFHPEIGEKINIYGHMSRSKPVLFCKQYQNGIKITSQDQFHELLEINKGNVYGICIDTARAGYLTGLHLPTMTLYYQEIID